MESTSLIVSSMRSLAVVTIYQVFYKFLGLNQSFLKYRKPVIGLKANEIELAYLVSGQCNGKLLLG